MKQRNHDWIGKVTHCPTCNRIMMSTIMAAQRLHASLETIEALRSIPMMNEPMCPVCDVWASDDMPWGDGIIDVGDGQ